MSRILALKRSTAYVARGSRIISCCSSGSRDTVKCASFPSPRQSVQSRSFHTARALNEKVKFLLADIGEGIKKVTIKEWHVKVGDRVSEFDQICEVQSDKAAATITSRYDGVVTHLYHDIDDTALVGQPLVIIETDGSAATNEEHSEKDANSDSSSKDAVPETPQMQESPKRIVLTTPAVRRLARDNDVDLASVGGTGPQGRVLKEDILRHIQSTSIQPRLSEREMSAPVPPITSTPLAPASPTPAADVASRPQWIAPPPPSGVVPADRTEKIVGFRKTMVQTMTAANDVPTFGFSDEVNMNALVRVREQLKDLSAARGLKMSYMPFFIKAASTALSQYPVLNSSPNGDCTTLTYKGAHNIGIAMDTPGGLVVPNIKSVQAKSIFEVAAELQRLMALGSEGKLGISDLTGGTFSLSNIGAVGGTYARPILLPPEVLIGALGRMQAVPRYLDNDQVVKTHILNISWSADHRVIDGATVARFSNLWKSYLEQPATLLVDLR